MCDLINNHTDGGENWTVIRCYVEKKGEIIIKEKKTACVSENITNILLKLEHISLEAYCFFEHSSFFYLEKKSV